MQATERRVFLTALHCRFKFCIITQRPDTQFSIAATSYVIALIRSHSCVPILGSPSASVALGVARLWSENILRVFLVGSKTRQECDHVCALGFLSGSALCSFPQLGTPKLIMTLS